MVCHQYLMSVMNIRCVGIESAVSGLEAMRSEVIDSPDSISHKADNATPSPDSDTSS